MFGISKQVGVLLIHKLGIKLRLQNEIKQRGKVKYSLYSHHGLKYLNSKPINRTGNLAMMMMMNVASHLIPKKPKIVPEISMRTKLCY